jgi:hypothetical protein
MAGRPHKQGLDYFSFDIDFFDNNKIDELMEYHSAHGVIFYQQILCSIYRKGNVLKWDRMALKLFRKTYGYTPDQVHTYLAVIIKLDLLNRDLYEKYSILTSDSIQERYLYSTKRREKVIYIQEYLLIDLDSYKSVSHTVEVHDLDGALIKKYTRDINSKGKKPVKPKKDVTPQKPPAPITPPAAAAPPAPSEFKGPKEHLQKDVIAFIKVPYESRDDIFRDSYSKEEYEQYVQINKIIDAKCVKVRTSVFQLTFPEFIEFMYECGTMPTMAELELAYRKMAELGVNKNMDIYHRLAACLEMIRTPFKPNAPPAELPEQVPIESNYVPDEAFEKKMLDYWEFEPVRNHKQFALIRAFCMVNFNEGKLDWFKEQFANYTAYKDITGYKHLFNNFIGKQSELFADGAWNDEVWSAKLIEAKKKLLKDNGHGNKHSGRTTGQKVKYYGKV